MDWLARFFAWDVDPGLLLYGQYDPWLVALSVGVAIFSSTVGLYAAGKARDSSTAALRRMMRLTGSFSLACGVWAMHFVGMLAFELCTTVHVDVGLTVLSGLPALGAAWVALTLLSQRHVHRTHLLFGGALMGAGIGTMHYLGMAAMELTAALRYDPFTFALSVAVAVVLSILALGLRFGLANRRGLSSLEVNLIAGVFMGGAIAGMHYTGMAAARFIGRASPLADAGLMAPAPLALGVALVTVVATALVAAVTALARYRQLLLAMQVQATQLKAVVDTSIDGIVVMDAQGTVLAFNAGAARITGLGEADMLGSSVGRFMIEPHRSRVHKDFGAYMRSFPFGVAMDTAICHVDGSERPIRLVVGQATSERGTLYAASMTDISERVAMEKALRHSEQQFRSLIDNIPGISYRSKLGKGWPMVYISDAVEGITGHPAAGFVGEHPATRLLDLVAHDDAERLHKLVIQAVVHGRPFVVEFKLTHRDGSTRWMWGTGRGVHDEDGELQWVDGVLLDISQRREMEEDLRAAKQLAEDAMHARTAFLANMSHEIRTPMNAIIGFTEAVLSQPLEGEARQHLQTVRTAARSLLVLLNDILDTSKLDRGAVELEHLPFDLRRVLQQVVAEQQLMARRKGLQLNLQCAPELPAALMGDAHRMRQVLVNLVGNAVKFTEQGQVTLGARLEGQRLRLWVQDTGIGIAPERLDRIFEPFTQADASMSRRYGGTGLGTTISRQLVELMGGRIWAESEPGQGSCFHVDLPCEPAAHAQLAPDEPEASARALRPLRVLVADDVDENRQLLAVVLGRAGHQVSQARDGLEAVAAFEAGGIDLILMDLQMPELDGLSACRRIRAIEAERGSPRLPIVALSASAFAEDRQQANDVGMDGFALKPVDPPALVAEMRRAWAICQGETVDVDKGVAEAAGQGLAAHPSPAAPAETDLLDARAGRQRWGDDQAWAQALSQFCRHKRDWLREAHAQHPDQGPPEPPEALLLGHRFKGVAANLGMGRLARAAGQLEQAARDAQGMAQPDIPLGVWEGLRQAVVDTLEAAQAELLALSTQVPGAGVGAGGHVGSPAVGLDAIAGLDDAQWRHTLQQLARALRGGEHPEGAWRALMRQGPSRFGNAPWAGLNQAIDDFDFDAAAAGVEALLASLGPAPAPPPWASTALTASPARTDQAGAPA
jgi:PAS domain S-box-containing protein